jgi:hypothetical protein
MQNRLLVITNAVVCLFFLPQCISPRNTTDTGTAQDHRNLIAFAEYDAQNEENWGYLDEDTNEIVINAKYANATPFVGNFAIVRKEYQSRQIIIDKNEKVISTPQFDQIYLLASESGKNTVAILERELSRTKLQIGGSFLGISTKTHFYKTPYSRCSLFNLVTGKIIVPEKENYLQYDIEAAGDYLIVCTDLYQFLDNGDIARVAKNNPELAVNILEGYFETRGINARVRADHVSIDIDYCQYIQEKYAEPELRGAHEKLNPDFTMSFDKAEPFYRNPMEYLNTPLEINERKYLLYFRNKETHEYAVGLYNESKAEWLIVPRFNINFSDKGQEEFYVIDIHQTNNPHLYHLHFTNDAIGWNILGRYATVAGSIYSTVTWDFEPYLYLYNGYRNGNIPLPTWGGRKIFIRFPRFGVSYRDYSRTKKYQ